ncbi:MAG: hypothetical protein ACI91R_002266 [Vicingaceae bacterium]|jgi:hypothetical protein
MKTQLFTLFQNILRSKKTQLAFANPKESYKRDCLVCGMDEWCGTDGCPMDPQ